jgi:hypothetical protein
MTSPNTCVYCEKEIVDGAVVRCGGDAFHNRCYDFYREDINDAFINNDMEYNYASYEDYEPNPYDGTYSEM